MELHHKLFAYLALLAIFANCGYCRCTATVKEGSRGECVREVQKAVGTTVDGIFGKNTKTAVIAFQRKKGLDADGIVGPKTWNAIYGGSTSPSKGCGCSYDYAGSTCSGGPSAGGRKLAAYLKRKFGSRQDIYNCRSIAGSSRKSLHAEGRAIDHYVSGAKGTEIFDHLISIACANGIQEIIYNRKIWTKAQGTRAYTGVNPHTDHVHVGLNRCGAKSFDL